MSDVDAVSFNDPVATADLPALLGGRACYHMMDVNAWTMPGMKAGAGKKVRGDIVSYMIWLLWCVCVCVCVCASSYLAMCICSPKGLLSSLVKMTSSKSDESGGQRNDERKCRLSSDELVHDYMYIHVCAALKINGGYYM